MGNLFTSPQWFFGYDIVLEVLFAVITFFVCYFAWRSYRLTGDRNIRLFSLAFLFISLSYIVQSILNLIMIGHLQSNVCSLVGLQSIYHLSLFGIYMHAILFLIGLLLLAYISLRIYSFQTFVLMSILVFASLYFSINKTFMLYLLSTILLGFIVYYYLNNYWSNRKATTLLVAVAMISLFVSYLFFIFAIDSAAYYVTGHILELGAYILVLINLLIILRMGKQRLRKHDKKTR